MTESHCSSGDGRPVNPGRPRTPRIDTEELRDRVSTLDVARLLSEGEGRPVPGWDVLRCPMPNHEDRNPSFQVSRRTKSFRCRSCGLEGSGPFDLVMAVNGCDFVEAVRWVADKFGSREQVGDPMPRRKAAPPPPPADTPVEESFEAAKRHPEAFQVGVGFRAKLARERCWNDVAGESAIDHFKIELVEDQLGALRYRFPFFKDGVAGYWQDRAVRDSTRVKWKGPKGTCPIPFNLDSLDHEDFPLLVEGIPDAVTAWHLKATKTVIGIPGTGSAKDRWLAGVKAYAEHFGFRIVVITDNDPPGQQMRERLDEALGDLVRHVYVPEDYGDLTDWWVEVGHDNEIERDRMVSALRDAGEEGPCLSSKTS